MRDDDESRSLNREDRDGDPWAGVSRLVGSIEVGWVIFYDDGTAEAVVPGTRQRRPYRYVVARDRETGEAWRRVSGSLRQDHRTAGAAPTG